ncbi:MAG: copper oxidase [Planctomycetes bacterium]|nr:copper oxidase [Planctomycetota bacterium]
MDHDRRQFLFVSTAAGLGGALPARAASPHPTAPRTEPTAVETPNGSTLPWRVQDGVKIGHLVVAPVRHEFAPGLEGNCYGYNGRVHGPTIEAVEGDRVRIYVTNRLDVPTTVHWHGMLVPNGMDGVGGLTQRSIEPGETFRYEFDLGKAGTFMFHSHHDEMVQMAMGLVGMFVVHPKAPSGPLPDRDFVYMLGEWALKVGTERPDPNEMKDFNVLTLNGKVFPATAPMVVKTGQRVRIRIGNLSAMDHHPMHLHGHAFTVTATDGGDIPPSARCPETTVLVAAGQTRTIEFVADAPGDWAFHCHMTHHVMTQMGHDIPNLVGVDPSLFDRQLAKVLPTFLQMGRGDEQDPAAEDTTMPKNSLPMVGGLGGHGYVTMGGMVTVLKVRDGITGYDDPGYYTAPAGTLANVALPEELARDGIRVD